MLITSKWTDAVVHLFDGSWNSCVFLLFSIFMFVFCLSTCIFCCCYLQWLQLIQGCTCRGNCSNCRLLIYSHHISAVAWIMLQFAILRFFRSLFKRIFMFIWLQLLQMRLFFFVYFFMLSELSDFDWRGCVIGGHRLALRLYIFHKFSCVCVCVVLASSWQEAVFFSISIIFGQLFLRSQDAIIAQAHSLLCWRLWRGRLMSFLFFCCEQLFKFTFV